MEILKAVDINKSCEDNYVLKDVSITLNEGEIVSLLGVSGSGKTTLFNVLSGIYTPDSGKVFLKGEDVTGKPGKISYMLQKDLLFPYRRVIDNVTLPLTLHGMKKKEAREKANEYFSVFGLDGTQMKYPSQLSGGMRQRAALLRTYLSSNGVALLDEPWLGKLADVLLATVAHQRQVGVVGPARVKVQAEHGAIGTLLVVGKCSK